MNLKGLLVIILFALVIVFVLQNTQVVEVRFLFWELSMSRALMLLASLLVGILAGWFLPKRKPRKPQR